MRGSLSQARVAVLIREIHGGDRNGVLHLTRAGVSRRLYFKAGSLILAGSDLPEDRLGQILVRAGMIQEADLARALGVVDASDRTIGETIVEMGLLRREQVQVAAARRTKRIVASVLDWDSGEYVFEEREDRLEGELLAEVSVPETLLEWLRGDQRGDVVRLVLGDAKGVLHRPQRPTAALAALLTSSEAWVLEQANGVSSAAQIAAQSPMGEAEAFRSICGLLLAGVFELAPPQGSAGTVLHAPPREELGAGTSLWAALEAERADAGFGGQTNRLFSRQPPDALGRYVVEKAIGRGSMGAVLLARDPAIDRRVAVKLIQTSVQLTPPEWEKYKERFYREARAAGKLLHQGIVTIFDVGHTVEGIPFIVMEYVEGRTLAALAEEAELPLEETLRLAGLCLEALEYAHSQGVVHRDLKPANIMITADGRPKIMDFGVAHVVGSQMTQADEILGSPHFMAPEQLGKGKVDQRTDLFAFGVVLYWMLTGRLPFTGDSFAAIASAVLSERAVSPKDLKQNVPRALGAIVLRCLEKDPAKRFANAGELRAKLRSVIQPRGMRARAIAGLALLLLAGIGAGYYFLRRPTAAVREVASSPPSTVPRPSTASPPSSVARPSAAPRPRTVSPPTSVTTPPQDDASELAWRKTLPLTFTARHDHRIGSCTGSLLLTESGIEYRSREHERLRLGFDEVRIMQRESARRLHLETDERGELKSYNFSLVSRPLSDADWARYRRLAKK